ncbi:helix-turn-helix transcriptional regulator [Nocardia sp. NPDC005745]|uniref:helix-turn-helix domain-containing protein n=1 Tax=Nocardia sp. NPDC005745 TaxID=3157061 RepID=UPI0033F8985A
MSGEGDDISYAPEEDAGPIARHLNRVIAAAQQRDSRSYSNKDIAERSTALGYPLSPAQVSHIRLGRVRNPSFRTVEGISVALGVDVREFLDGAAAQQADVESRLAAELSEAGVEAIGFRLSELGTLNELGRSTFGAIVGNILRDLQQHELYRRPTAAEDDEKTEG